MHDPRVPHPEYERDKLVREEDSRQEDPGRPEVIQEEIIHPPRAPREPGVAREDMVRSTRLPDESNTPREDTPTPGTHEKPAARIAVARSRVAEGQGLTTALERTSALTPNALQLAAIHRGRVEAQPHDPVDAAHGRSKRR